MTRSELSARLSQRRTQAIATATKLHRDTIARIIDNPRSNANPATIATLELYLENNP